MSLKNYLFLFVAFLSLQSCTLGRFVCYNFADITDYKIFPEHKIEKGEQTFYFPVAQNPKSPKTIEFSGKEVPFDQFLEENKTVAFLIIHRDSIQYERYFNGYDTASTVASFSMAKSVTSMLVGIAIEEGYIRTVHDSIGDYISGLKHPEIKNTTILQLLQMTSGLKFGESYVSPFSEVATFYYGRNLRKKSKRLKIKKNADFQFNYQSGNTQLLGLVLDNALPEDMSISDYLEAKIWKPLHMRFDATWSLDDKKHSIEKTFCCLNARALDFAKLGRLYLHQGRFQGEQIVPEAWVKRSTKVDTTAGSAWYYQYGWWLPTKTGDFMAHGILGQYIYVNPQKDLIIVRLGKKEAQDWESIFVKLASLY